MITTVNLGRLELNLSPLATAVVFYLKTLQRLKLIRAIAIFSLVVCLSIMVSCAQAPPPLRVGTNLWPGFESFYLARNLGYYENTPIRMVEYPSSSEVIRAYRNGELEAAALTLDEVLLLATTDPQIRVVLINDTSDGADAILAKPEIQTLAGLKNKRVGVESTALGAYILTRALQQVQLSPQEVQIVPLQASEHETAFKQGKVDAVVTFEPTRSNLLTAGANLVFDSKQIPDEIVDVLAVREALVTSQSSALHTLIQGWFRGLDYLKQNPQDAANRVAPRQGVTPQQFLESLEGLKTPGIVENQKLLSKTDPSLLEGAKQLAKVMVENKLLDQPVDPTLLLDDRLVKNIQPKDIQP